MFRLRSKRIGLLNVSDIKARMIWTLTLAFALILSSGCVYTGGLRDYVHNGFKVGPEYCKPAAPVADAWIDSYDDRIRSELPDSPEWWTVFNDPILTDLVYGAYQQNLPLKVAGAQTIYSVRLLATNCFPKAVYL